MHALSGEIHLNAEPGSREGEGEGRKGEGGREVKAGQK